MNRIIKITLFLIFCLSFFSCVSKPIEGEFSSESEKAITKQRLIDSLNIDYGILQLVDEEGNIIPLEMYDDETTILEVIERTDKIPIKDDLPFGVIIDLSNLPSKDFKITWMTEFPEPGLYDSETGEYV